MSFASAEQPIESTLSPEPIDDSAPTDETQPETPETDGAAAVPIDPAVEMRESRKERKADRARIYQQNEEFKRQNQELQAKIDRMAQVTTSLAESVQRTQPKQEDPMVTKFKELNNKRLNAAARMGSDPNAITEYHDAIDDIAALKGKMAAREERESMQASQPKQHTAEQATILREYSWLSEDKDAGVYADAIVTRLARTQKRDMTNPQVRMATLREACAITERDFPELSAVSGRDPNAAARLAGTGGKSTGQGGGGSMPTADEDTMAMAMARFPNEASPEASYKKLYERVIKPIQAQRKS